MQITEERLEKLRTPAGGYNAATLRALGLTWPVRKGWRDRLLGTWIEEETWRTALEAARGPGKKWKKKSRKSEETKRRERALRPIHKKQAKLLRPFWRKVEKGNLFGREDILRELRRLSFVTLPETPLSPPEFRRKEFGLMPEFQGFEKGKCLACRGEATERHHIIAIKHGGLNTVRNVVPICHSCHCDIHPWMARETGYSELDSMIKGGAFS